MSQQCRDDRQTHDLLPTGFIQGLQLSTDSNNKINGENQTGMRMGRSHHCGLN
jgi:hypothetical protein